MSRARENTVSGRFRVVERRHPGPVVDVLREAALPRCPAADRAGAASAPEESAEPGVLFPLHTRGSPCPVCSVPIIIPSLCCCYSAYGSRLLPNKLTFPGSPQNAEGVALVDEDARLVLPLEVDDPRQRADISRVGIEALDYYETADLSGSRWILKGIPGGGSTLRTFLSFTACSSKSRSKSSMSL